MWCQTARESVSRQRVAVQSRVCLFTRISTRVVTSAADMQSSVPTLVVRCLRSADGGVRTPLEIETRDVCRGVK